MTYKVIAPLVIIAHTDRDSETGQGDWYGYEKAVVPEGFNDERCEQLVKDGMLEKVEASKADADSDGPPAKSASKGDWEAYARTQGAEDADLDGKTKDDLIAAYGG